MIQLSSCLSQLIGSHAKDLMILSLVILWEYQASENDLLSFLIILQPANLANFLKSSSQKRRRQRQKSLVTTARIFADTSPKKSLENTFLRHTKHEWNNFAISMAATMLSQRHIFWAKFRGLLARVMYQVYSSQLSLGRDL